MGWGRMLLLGNVGQQLDIQDTEEALAKLHEELRASGAANRDVAGQLEALRTENAELKLYLAAVMRLLTTKGVIAPAELQQIVDAIDRSDGQADGQFTGKIPPA